MGLSNCSATHATQRTGFIALMKTKVTSVDPEDILNMDQTLIPFSYHSMRTLEKK